MITDLEKLMAKLSDSERDRLRGAFAADPELAEGLSAMLAGLPLDTQAQVMRRLAARLTSQCRLAAERWCRRSPMSSRMPWAAPSARAARTSRPG